MAPIARAIALALAVGGVIGDVHAQRAFSPAWFASKSAAHQTTAQTGRLPNGLPASRGHSPAGQQQKANETLRRSLDNLNRSARGIAAQQAAQAEARAAAANAAPDVPDGLATGGLKVDGNSLTAGWRNARNPAQRVVDGRTVVTIAQTADKAVLNWETFNVGRNTTVDFDQATYDASGNRTAQTDWVVLNKVNDPSAHPSRIQGQIRGDGTVMIVNRNGVVFSGTSQVNTRNLVAAAANISLDQFDRHGLYGADASTATFSDALGKVEVQAGARITTHEPQSVTQGGGYVLLAGSAVHQAGEITTSKGQTQLAAGDSFIIRKGVGTEGNTASTTRGNEIAPRFGTDSTAGAVSNTGLILSREGDITLAGRDVRQDGAAISSSTFHTRGTIHLLNSASDTQGKVSLGQGAVTAILIEDDGKASALDSQRDALLKESAEQDALRLAGASPAFDNLSVLQDRRDQSRIEIVSGGTIHAEGDSLTLATGGQIVSSATGRSFVAERAQLDVSGAVGVSVAMESNNIKVNVQGNELRDSPDNRDSGRLHSKEMWIDRRSLIHVPAGTGGYEADRWYTAGGLLEVSGWLSNHGHSTGEWAAQGGTVTLAGSEVVTQLGSVVNLSGGTLDVQAGRVSQTWLKGSNGRLYEVGKAPAGMTFTSVYLGYEAAHARWNVTRTFYNPLIGPRTRRESGYTVGRDAGQLIISAPTAILEGDIDAGVFNGDRQVNRPDAIADGYRQAQTAVARAGRLEFGRHGATQGPYPVQVRVGGIQDVTAGMTIQDALDAQRLGTAWLDAQRLSGQGLGGVTLQTQGSIVIEQDLALAHGGALALVAPVIDVAGKVTARSGTIVATNWFSGGVGQGEAGALRDAEGGSRITLKDGATLDVRGLWVNAALDPSDGWGMAYLDGGDVQIASTHDVVLQAGSRIDASSGGGVRSMGSVAGGRGGDVTLIADLANPGNEVDGLLTLDGEIAAHGVTGGGTLQVESGTGIVIGGEALQTRDVLAAGEAAPVQLILADSYTVRAGEIMPTASAYQATLVPAGAALGNARILASASAPLVNAVQWQVPRPVGTYTTGQVEYYPPGSDQLVSSGVYGETSTNLPVVPAGSRIVRLTVGDPGWIVSAAVFPDGLPTQAHTRTLSAGEVAPSDIVLAAGSRIVQGSILQRGAPVKALAYLGTELFQTGFSRYDINGRHGVVLAEGAQLAVQTPVLKPDDGAMRLPSRQADMPLSQWTPLDWLADPQTGVPVARVGASLLLRSTEGGPADTALTPAVGGVDLRANTRIQVDAGQSITLLGRDITVQGLLSAPGGTIRLDRPMTALERETGTGTIDAGLFLVGPEAVLDVAARAVTGLDVAGRRRGVVMDGGRIEIGGALDWEAQGEAAAPDAFVVIAAGARLDASGTSAMLDVGQERREVASHGGSIVIKSNNALYLDGLLRADAGGAGAAGGTLGLALQSVNYANLGNQVASGDILRHREFEVTQRHGDSVLDGATAARLRPQLVVGHARLGVDRIEAGGFDQLSLLVHGPLSFDGDVTLKMDQALRLYTGAYALTDRAVDGARVVLAAPHVLLAGATRLQRDYHVIPQVLWHGGTSQQAATGSIALQAELVDLRDRVGFGARGTAGSADGTYTVDRRAFSRVEIESADALRLLGGVSGRGLSGELTTELASVGDIAITAAQIYPATGAHAQIVAGWLPTGFSTDSTLTLRGRADTPPVPLSAFGALWLAAGSVDQGGVVRAPLGALHFGTAGTDGNVDQLTLRPGSLTSVSGAGLLLPYGGTTDGLTWHHAGEEVALVGAGGMATSGVLQGAEIRARHVDLQAGSVLDLSGGGELAGAGFIPGRGGSVDVLRTPLFSAGPGFDFSDSDNAVYALLPSHTGAHAPVSADTGHGQPLVGRQVTLAQGGAGLPAGTYTLLPSTYALLPGAFRIEIGATMMHGLSRTGLAGHGSWVAAGTLGSAHAGTADALPRKVVLTPSHAVRRHAAYDETSFSAFALADAARLGVPRAMLPNDARALDLRLARVLDPADQRPALQMAGILRMDAADDAGHRGMVQVRGLSEVLAPGQQPTAGLTGASVDSNALNALQAPRLVLNATLSVGYGEAGRIATVTGTGDLVVRSGATLAAGDLILATTPSAVSRSIVIEEGATLTTLGRGQGGFDSSEGYVFTGSGVLALSNGWMNLFYSSRPGVNGTVSLDIGACITVQCNRQTTLAAGGSLGLAAAGSIALRDAVSWGARDLLLGVSAINLGEDEAIAAASAAGALPDGLRLDQQRLSQLLSGNRALGTPALQSLTLNALQSVNLFGNASLDATALGRLVLGTPAIHGYAQAGETATLRAREFVWTGSPGTAATPVDGRQGDGRLEIHADRLLLGYGPYMQPENLAVDDRITLGFSAVSLQAADRVVAAGKGSFAAYHRQGAYVEGQGYSHSGGDLEILTPLLTAEAGAHHRLLAGGQLRVTGGGADASGPEQALGARLELTARDILVDTGVALRSGRLAMTASAGDIVLGARSHIDLTGGETSMFDVTRYSWGGDLVLESTQGGILQAAGSVIDLSAVNHRAGTLQAIALGAGGHVSLAGRISGSSSGWHDAGGTLVPFDAAEVSVRAGHIEDFAGLNLRLNDGGALGARRFQLRHGDLRVGDEVRSRIVEIALDDGRLTIDGRIDASGFQVGVIRLAARDGLAINGALDAHGAGLRRDSYGQIIDSPNRAIVELTTGSGELILGDGAIIDLRAGTGVPGHDSRAMGTLHLNAPRLGGNDVALQVAGTPVIHGAKRIAVNAFRVYDDAPLAALPDVTGHRPQEITQAWIENVVDAHNSAYMNAALGNDNLASRLAPLGQWLLRPGVEVRGVSSPDNPNGDLTVAGDLDLSGLRYGPDADRSDPARRGYGIPGVLVLRAAGQLNLRGSLNDGFAPPSSTPDDGGWVLTEHLSTGTGVTPFGGDIVVPRDGVVLDAGTRFPAGATLNYAISVAGVTLPAGTVLPVAMTLAGSMELAGGTVVPADVWYADGTLAHAAGKLLAEPVMLTAGMTLGAGMPLRAATAMGPMNWPRGVKLPVAMTTTTPTALAQGALIPAMTGVELPGNIPVDLRPRTAGGQGRNWAVAPMLGAGAPSWDLRLVAGADMDAIDSRALASGRDHADLIMADTHYVARATVTPGYWLWGDDPASKNPSAARPGNRVTATIHINRCNSGQYDCVRIPDLPSHDLRGPAHSVMRTGTGDLELLAGGDVRMHSLYGVYTAGTSTPVDAMFQLARGTRADGTLIGSQSADHAAALADWRAWYPTDGGNLLVVAGADLIGDLMGYDANRATSALTGNWLWRQGSGDAPLADLVAGAWWINFGTYVLPERVTGSMPALTGFVGLGTLGGGNVAVRVDGNAGTIARRGSAGTEGRSQGLVVAIGSTGRVDPQGQLLLTGGGDMDLRIAGALNPARDISSSASESPAMYGAVVNLRGHTRISAGDAGSVQLRYRFGSTGRADGFDGRGMDPFLATSGVMRGGVTLVPGDAVMRIETLGDLVLGGAGDATRSHNWNGSPFADYSGGGNGWFTLWTPHTAIELTSAGGNLAPITSAQAFSAQIEPMASDQVMADGWFTYPSILRAAALAGSVFYGEASGLTTVPRTGSLMLAPSPRGALEILAAGTLNAGGFGISLSGSGATLPTPWRPAFIGTHGAVSVSNLSRDGIATPNALFALGPNTAAVDLVSEGPMSPMRFYARDGDIIGVRSGEIVAFPTLNSVRTLNTWYAAGAPVWIQAGRDIVSAGMPLGVDGQRLSTEFPRHAASVSGSLIVHRDDRDMSLLSAGRDILQANFDIAGPGLLSVSAGRHILQRNAGALTSIGAVVPGDLRPGASIAVMAGNRGVDWSALRARYLDPARLADPARPLADQPGMAANIYEEELTRWLEDRYGFTGSPIEALAYFDALAPEQQHIFLRQVYFAELRAGGREYNAAGGPRFGSYLRGREAIATLFPDADRNGHAIDRTGDIILFGGSGVRTNFGGDIHLLAPGGQIVVGVQGEVPPASAGVMTQGAGSIQLFSQQSLLLGLSRIMTTFGGDILAWSEAGDINAGRGSKTTVLFTPPKRGYDSMGNVTLAPQVPSSGAGIATLNPIPEVPPGDIDLIAPLGVIDAGEAGIRVSGNVNLAALQVVNAENIQAQGEAKGLPAMAAVDVGALTNASAAASQAGAAAQDVMQRERAAARQTLPSIITVQVLGFGDTPLETAAPASQRSGGKPDVKPYDTANFVQILGAGQRIKPDMLSYLSDAERRQLQGGRDANRPEREHPVPGGD